MFEFPGRWDSSRLCWREQYIDAMCANTRVDNDSCAMHRTSVLDILTMSKTGHLYWDCVVGLDWVLHRVCRG